MDDNKSYLFGAFFSQYTNEFYKIFVDAFQYKGAFNYVSSYEIKTYTAFSVNTQLKKLRQNDEIIFELMCIFLSEVISENNKTFDKVIIANAYNEDINYYISIFNSIYDGKEKMIKVHDHFLHELSESRYRKDLNKKNLPIHFGDAFEEISQRVSFNLAFLECTNKMFDAIDRLCKNNYDVTQLTVKEITDRLKGKKSWFHF